MRDFVERNLIQVSRRDITITNRPLLERAAGRS
jgi:hypothetical protein